MAFAVVASSATTVGTSAASPGVAMTMPSGITAGELLLAFVSGDGSVSFTASGWTSIQGNNNGTAAYHQLFGKIAAGSDTMTLVRGSDTNDFVCTVCRITDHGVATLTTDILKAVATGTTTNPEPPSLTISTTRDWLIIESFGADDDDLTATAWWTSTPDVFTTIAQNRSATGTTSTMLSLAYLNKNTGTSYDPGQMAMAASEEWIAFTIAIPPDYIRDLSGTSAIDTPLTTPGTIDVVHIAVLSGTTPIGYIAGGTNTYYFDAHTSISDQVPAWTADQNAFDNDITVADYATTDLAGANLVGTGTTAPTSGGGIASVQFSMDYSFTAQGTPADSPSIEIYSVSQFLGGWAGSVDTTAQTTTDWIPLDITPTGGWTWPKVAELTAKLVIITGGA